MATDEIKGTTCRFGTDGVRGKVGLEPMVPDTIVRLGYAIGTVLGGRGREVIIGKDTRLSGYMVESAIEAGLAATGIDVVLTGPLPTSAVARLTKEEGAAAGIVISASHNPYQDNGIKVFDADGNKLSDQQEAEIEHLVGPDGPAPQWASEPGKARRIDDAGERYVNFVLDCLPGINLQGMHVVVDAANGAAYATAPAALRRTRAHVYELGCSPDGRNINIDCGALVPETAKQFLIEHNFDVALTLDGDADRLIMIDATGRLIDGDAYLYVMCKCLHKLGRAPQGVVGTLLSNSALADALKELNIELARAPVGDRNVAQLMKERGWQHGSEPSGHILLFDLHVTGDGLLSALSLLQLLAEAEHNLAEVVAGYQPLPSVTRNVQSHDPQALQDSLAAQETELSKREGVGRIILRPSGTEPVLRILVEAEQESLALAIVEELCAAAG